MNPNPSIARRRLRRVSAFAATILTASAAGTASAGDALDASLDEWLALLAAGTVKLDVRGRYEYADIRRGPRPSNAVTLRTRLGYGTKPWEGISGYAEFENVSAADRDAYFDGIPPANRKSLVADPTTTELNQAYVEIDREDFGSSRARVGRQRIVLDDARFIGNVGWRQNEQTYDAAFAETALGVEGLVLQYGYLDEVQRIFGDQGGPGTRDFDANAHLARSSYEVAPWLRATAFVYLLDLRNAPTLSSNSYGVRAEGSVPLRDGWSASYQASVAHQRDGGTSGGRNPVNYEAWYALGDLAIAFAPLGSVGGGYEHLGSDSGRAVFATPLATAHKFNGWADAFVNNGGPEGLRDVYAYVSPKLPWKLSGRAVYHHFFSDHRERDLGSEFDAVLSRKFGRYVTLLTKVAWYDGRGPRSGSPADRVRYWVEATFAF